MISFVLSQYILLPLYSFVRLFVYSFDVIHTLGIYSVIFKDLCSPLCFLAASISIFLY